MLFLHTIRWDENKSEKGREKYKTNNQNDQQRFAVMDYLITRTTDTK